MSFIYQHNQSSSLVETPSKKTPYHQKTLKDYDFHFPSFQKRIWKQKPKIQSKLDFFFPLKKKINHHDDICQTTPLESISRNHA